MVAEESAEGPAEMLLEAAAGVVVEDVAPEIAVDEVAPAEAVDEVTRGRAVEEVAPAEAVDEVALEVAGEVAATAPEDASAAGRSERGMASSGCTDPSCTVKPTTRPRKRLEETGAGRRYREDWLTGSRMSDTLRVPPATKKPDTVLLAAADFAREALAEEVGDAEVGQHLRADAEGDRLLTHYFASTNRGYVGWNWAVTLTRASRHKSVTVNEIVLLPGVDSLTAPPWLPWKNRVGKDDLGPGDLVPVTEDDPRLVPGYLVGDEPLDEANARQLREVTRELGLGRERVLSVEGRSEAAERWSEGTHGPDSPLAQAAPAPCGTCGFLARLSGPLATLFGVCANESSPSDGHAVSFDHGCGAHSDVRVEPSQHSPATASPVHDTLSWDVFAQDAWTVTKQT